MQTFLRKPNSPILTIGYGKRSVTELIRELTNQQTEYVIDVRSTPYSRFKPAFNKEALAASLESQRIKYVFMGENLGGIPQDSSCYRNGKIDYGLCSEAAWFQEGVRRLRTASQKGLRVALLCSEERPEACHRSKLIGQVLTQEGIAVLHVDEHGQLKSQLQVISRLTKGQKDLFDLPFPS